MGRRKEERAFVQRLREGFELLEQAYDDPIDRLPPELRSAEDDFEDDDELTDTVSVSG